MAFNKLYKGSKSFFPGQKLQFSFRGKDVKVDEESLSMLKSILNQKKRKIIENTKKLFCGKELNFTKKPLQYNCNFIGAKVKRHLQSGSHKFPEEKAKLYESFIWHQLNHVTLIVIHQMNKPTMYHICKTFFDRTDTHFQHFHQCKRQTHQMN